MVLSQKKKIKILITLFIITVVVWKLVFLENRDSDILEIDFFDVGQGDGIFIETGDKKQVLIDGGPSAVILDKLGKEMAFYDRYIDLAILTHPEYDHISGLIEVIKRYKIGVIIATGIVRETSQYKEFIRIIEQKNIPVYIAQLGGAVELNKDIKLNILYPFESLLGKKISNTNNSSVVGKLVYKDFEVLLTGDIEKSVEKKLIGSGLDLRADVLKIAHHGSKTSSTKEFLKAVGSLINIIPAGKDNKYGHPHQEVLERMANVFVTGSGNIKILTDGVTLLVR